MSQLDEYQINVYDFPNYETEDKGEKLIPFAVVGSNVVVQVRMSPFITNEKYFTHSSPDSHYYDNLQDENGKRVRGRKYPWGTVNIEDKNHCDFLSLRSLVLAHHMQVKYSEAESHEI